MQDVPMPDTTQLLKIVQTTMPFGKYKGKLLCDIPINYLEWMYAQPGGFKKDTLGQLLSTVYEIKLNGLENVLIELKKMK